MSIGLIGGLSIGLIGGLSIGLNVGLIDGLTGGLSVEQKDRITYPGQRLVFTAKNFLLASLLFGLILGLFGGLIGGLFFGLTGGLFVGLFVGLSFGLIFGLQKYGGIVLIKHYVLRLILSRNNLLPWKLGELVPFLNHCVDLIFLRRVGGGYIFVHHLLMEHFAERLNHDLKD